MKHTQSWSLSETRALSVKAARGAGLPWGLAEEAGFAIHWLESRASPGIAALAAYLDAGLAAGNECPIHIGAAVSDGAIDLADGFFTVHQPLLLVPFIAQANEGHGHLLTIGAGELAFNITGFETAKLSGHLTNGPTQCRLSASDRAIEGRCRSRVPAEYAAAIKRLEHHAHKTYAPATEESRLAGAGAGLTDND